MAIAAVSGAMGRSELAVDPLARVGDRLLFHGLQGLALGWAFGFLVCAFHYFVQGFVRWVLLAHLVVWMVCTSLSLSPSQFENVVRAVGIATTVVVWILIVSALVSGRPRPRLAHFLIISLAVADAVADAVAWAMPLSGTTLVDQWSVAQAVMVLAQGTMVATYVRWLWGGAAEVEARR